MHHREVQGFNAPEIIRVEHVLGTRALPRRRSNVGLKQVQNRLQNRKAGHAHLFTGHFEVPGQLLINQSKQNDSWRQLDFRDRSMKQDADGSSASPRFSVPRRGFAATMIALNRSAHSPYLFVLSHDLNPKVCNFLDHALTSRDRRGEK